MKYVSMCILLLAMTCNTPKKETKNIKEESTPTTSTEKMNSTETNKENELVVVLNNPKKVIDAKALITNSGLIWSDLNLSTKGVVVGLITVPKNKKEFWLQRLKESNVFEQVKAGDEKIISEIKNEIENRLISVRKTPCFGDCPVYTLTINKEGKAIFFGKQYVLKEGKHEFQLSENELKSLLEKINNSNFNKFAEVYDNPRITDLPSTYIFCNGKQIKIRLWKNIPDQLVNVHEYVTEFLYDKKFIE